MERRPTEGIVTDAAHSEKFGITEYQAVSLKTGKRLFYKNLGYQTVNIGEFLGLVEGAKYILENNIEPKVVYTDSMIALTWYKRKRAASKKKNLELRKAEVWLQINAAALEDIEVVHWNSSYWGESPADFGNK